MLTLSDVGAKMLGVAEITMNPMEDDMIIGVSDGKVMEEIRSLVLNTTMESPVVQYDGELLINGEWLEPHHLPQYVGA